MKLISGSSNLLLATSLAKHLSLPLSPVELFLFPDGERRVRIEESVVNEDAVIVQSTSAPVDTHYMELFFLIDALNRSGARSITLVMPYIGYQRQDHVFRSGEAVSFEVINTMLSSLKVDRVITYDLHAVRIEDEFKTHMRHLSALPLFAEKLRKDENVSQDTVLVAPDSGGLRRVRLLADLIQGIPFAGIKKNRDRDTGQVQAVSYDGVVKKRAIIVDDIISTGETIIKGAQLLRSLGFQRIDVFATHGLLIGNAPMQLQNSVIDTVTVTDSIAVSQEKQFPKLIILSLGHMIANELSKE